LFVPDGPLAKLIAGQAESKARVATLQELFKTKCLVCALRSKTRDWFDLYLLFRDHGFSIHDFQAAFREAGVEAQCATALSRLCGGVPQKDDEGYLHLLPNPPSPVEMKEYFTGLRNLLEIESAAEALRRRDGEDEQS